MSKQTLKNTWLIAATGGWPSMSPPEEISKHARKPSAKEEKHFEEWVSGTVGEQWLPADFSRVPCLAEKGFVHVRQNRDYRVRIREAQKPLYIGCPVMSKALVMAVEPLAKEIPKPKTPNELLAFVRQFLSPGMVPPDPAKVEFIKPTGTIMAQKGKPLPPGHEEIAGGTFIGLWPVKGAPVVPYAWTDGKILLMALYEDVQYKVPPPAR